VSKSILGSPPRKSQIRYEPLPQDDPKQRRPDITKARQLHNVSRHFLLGRSVGSANEPKGKSGLAPTFTSYTTGMTFTVNPLTQ
jgi:hypothetical protein